LICQRNYVKPEKPESRAPIDPRNRLSLAREGTLLIRSTLSAAARRGVRALKAVLKTFYNPEIASHRLSRSPAASLTAPFKNANNTGVQARNAPL